MALRPTALDLRARSVADEIVAMANDHAARVPDPFETTAVYCYGQLHIAVGPRSRLVGVGVFSPDNGTFLITVCGRDEWAEFQSQHAARSRVRRRRARERKAHA